MVRAGTAVERLWEGSAFIRSHRISRTLVWLVPISSILALPYAMLLLLMGVGYSVVPLPPR